MNFIKDKTHPDQSSFIPDDVDMPEMTWRSLLLASILAMVLGSANVYIGLFAGMTVSASIPASIISMSILRSFFSNVSILENNIVQTGASAGGSLSAGVIFTIPALLMLQTYGEDGTEERVWMSPNYLIVLMLSICGGILGILFTIPIRRALLLELKPALVFPEGVACANVLIAGESGVKSAGLVVRGAIVGAVIKTLQAIRIATEELSVQFFIGNAAFYLSSAVSAALFGVGYIVGWRVGVVFLLGGICNWVIAIPIATAMELFGTKNSSDTAQDLALKAYSGGTKFLGVGAMIVGGLFALFSLRDTLLNGILAGVRAMKLSSVGSEALSVKTSLRTETDLPLRWCFPAVIVCVIPLYFVMRDLLQDSVFPIFLCLFVPVFGFFASTVAAYMAGLVGSSNNPISGVTVCVVLLTAGLMRMYLGAVDVGVVATIYVSAMIACAGAIAGDNMQDLKTGHVLGATPWRQQLALMLGVVSSAMLMPVVLTLLNSAYGFAPLRTSSEVKDSAELPAPQASLMAFVANGIIRGGLPWAWVAIGAVTALGVIAIDYVLSRHKLSFSVPVLAFAVGFYLPLSTGVAILAGSLVGVYVRSDHSDDTSDGVLAAGGLITGEALAGILLAIPIVISGNTSVLQLFSDGKWYITILMASFLLGWMYNISKGEPSSATSGSMLNIRLSADEERLMRIEMASKRNKEMPN